MRDPKPSRSSEPQLFETLLTTYAKEAAKGEQPDLREVAVLVAAKLGVSTEAVLGWANGAKELAAYAVAPTDFGSTLDEEDRGISAARRVVRPVLEVRVQARVSGAAKLRSAPYDCCTVPLPSRHSPAQKWAS